MTNESLEKLMNEFDKLNVVKLGYNDHKKDIVKKFIIYVYRTAVDDCGIGRGQEIIEACKLARKMEIEECIKLSDGIEAGKDTNYDEWRAFKGFRNALADKLKLLEEK
jgi:hypothetical protein